MNNHTLSLTSDVTGEDIATIVDLCIAQQTRQYADNPHLRQARSRRDIEEALSFQGIHDGPPLVARNAQGQVRGYAQPSVWSLKEDSPLLAFLTAQNGVMKLLTLPDPADQDADAVIIAFLTTLNEYWRCRNTSGDLFRWPSSDPWMELRLFEQGFRLDSICAYRPPDPFFPSRPLPSSELRIRIAKQKDEEAILRLFEEELRFHEQCTPFVHATPQVLASFRRELGFMWSGEDLEEGAPLILVAEQDHEVIAMAENTLLMIGPHDEPGFTPPGRYWCIDNVCVHEPMRGQGIGRLLVQAIEDVFETLSLKIAGYLLWYNPDNVQAKDFWSHLGFEPLWTTYQRSAPLI